LDELVKIFSIERVHKGGAKFDFEKAKWFNHQYIQHTDDATLATLAIPYLESGIGNSELGKRVIKDVSFVQRVVCLIKDRCHLLPDFWTQGHFFFCAPETIDEAAIRSKWNDEKQAFFTELSATLEQLPAWTESTLETHT